MAIDPSKLPSSSPRYFPNDSTTILLKLGPEGPKTYLIHSATKITQHCPPSLPWPSPFRRELYRGLFLGPTSIAYFFFLLSRSQSPAIRELIIEGRKAEEWARAYLDLGQDEVEPLMKEKGCGVANEYLSSNVLKAVLYREEKYAGKVLDVIRGCKTPKSWCEWLRGRAGALYLLRLLLKYLPGLGDEIKDVMGEVCEGIVEEMEGDGRWVWNGHQYLGAVHGEIGIVTQVMLSEPSYAPKLEGKLRELLRLQDEEGNWPTVPGIDQGLVQFCHGTPGFVVSLLAIKPFFKDLETEIDKAIEKGRRCVWKKGVLRKEPNVCHGVLGNALALEGREREQFLGLAMPEEVERGLKKGSWEKDVDGGEWGLFWGEVGRAWIWLGEWERREAEGNNGGGVGGGVVVLYTDL
jgi:hypothetical protein